MPIASIIRLSILTRTGEWFGIDDLIAALIGGTVNLVINIVQGNVHSFGQGLAYFGTSAAAGVLTIYVGPWAGGALIGAGNSFITQGFGSSGNWNWSNISGQQVLFDGIMGGLTGELGAALGNAISPAVGNLTSGIGGQGALTGFAVGTVSGMASGMRSAYKAGENPWTGNQNNTSNHAQQRTVERNVSQSDIMFPISGTFAYFF